MQLTLSFNKVTAGDSFAPPGTDTSAGIRIRLAVGPSWGAVELSPIAVALAGDFRSSGLKTNIGNHCAGGQCNLLLLGPYTCRGATHCRLSFCCSLVAVNTISLRRVFVIK